MAPRNFAYTDNVKFLQSRLLFQSKRRQKCMMGFGGIFRSDNGADADFARIDHLHVDDCIGECSEHLFPDAGMTSQANAHHRQHRDLFFETDPSPRPALD